MSKRSSLAVRLLLPAALVVLVATLATLQYHWLGQVSAAERESKKTTLRQRAEAFADDFDREIVELYIALQATRLTEQRVDLDTFLRSYDSWRKGARACESAPPPNSDQLAPLWTYRPEARTFETAPWPASLAPVRQRFVDTRQRGTTRFTNASSAAGRRSARVFCACARRHTADHPVVVWQQFQDLVQVKFNASYVVAELDRDTASTLLPALVTRYFPEHEAETIASP
jgi:hypothetical protein